MCNLVNPEKLAEVQSIFKKLQKADRDTLIYIHGRVDQAVEDHNKKT